MQLLTNSLGGESEERVELKSRNANKNFCLLPQRKGQNHSHSKQNPFFFTNVARILLGKSLTKLHTTCFNESTTLLEFVEFEFVKDPTELTQLLSSRRSIVSQNIFTGATLRRCLLLLCKHKTLGFLSFLTIELSVPQHIQSLLPTASINLNILFPLYKTSSTLLVLRDTQRREAVKANTVERVFIAT